MNSRASNIAMIVVVGTVLLCLLSGYRNCTRRGGHYVRGLFWMECIR
jgi:hypothetical protein